MPEGGHLRTALVAVGAALRQDLLQECNSIAFNYEESINFSIEFCPSSFPPIKGMDPVDPTPVIGGKKREFKCRVQEKIPDSGSKVGADSNQLSHFEINPFVQRLAKRFGPGLLNFFLLFLTTCA